MKKILFLLIMITLFGCSTERKKGLDLSEKEVKLTVFHTTDIHSKILPFQYTPNSWDKKMGMTPQDPQGHCTCDEGYYPLGMDCFEKDPDDSDQNCNFDSECSDSTSSCDPWSGADCKRYCSQDHNVCYECLEDSHCKRGSHLTDGKCVNFKCTTQSVGQECATDDNDEILDSECGDHGKCFNDNGSQYYGGMSRLAFMLELKRANKSRSIYLDSGDIYQGAPIFNFFQGEPELRALSILGVDAQALGNHEFDQGVQNWVNQVSNWVDYPLLAANYEFNNPEDLSNYQMPTVVAPYTILTVNGLDIAIIGLGNTASMVSIHDAGNSMGITPLDVVGITQYYVDLVKNSVDLVIINSHSGLDVDQVLCRELSDVDLIVGGHHHVVTTPVQEIPSKITNETCLMLHTGVNLRFLGTLDLIVKEVNPDMPGMEIISNNLEITPFDNNIDKKIESAKLKATWGICEDPEDVNCITKEEKRALAKYSEMKDMLDNYEVQMKQLLPIDEVIGHAHDLINRNENSGSSSPLGNMVASAMMEREFIDADFAVTNSLGIRADLPAGDIRISKIYEIFPFNNSITTMTLSGTEVKELFDYVAKRSAERGCMTQVQIAGANVTLNCRDGVAEDIKIGGVDLNPYGVYNLATNDYIAAGGSGFTMLARVTTKTDTGIEIRNVVMDYIREKKEIRKSDFADTERIVPKR